MKSIINTVIYTLAVFGMLSIVACKKFIEVEPPSTSVNEGNVFENDGTAISAVISIYTSMSGGDLSSNLSFYPELYADNMRLLNMNSITQIPFYQNSLLAGGDPSVQKLWLKIYPQVYLCNSAIKGLTDSKSTSLLVRKHLLGQVYFLRAFYYFYLTNFYGDVPLALGTDYKVNNSLKKTSSKEVYSLIINDLKQAQMLLPENYLMGDMKTEFASGEQERVSANRSAATALLARVYLYQKDWVNAEASANEVIQKSDLYSSLVPLENVFLKNSKETIWAIQPVYSGANAPEADLYTLRIGEPAETSPRSGYLSSEFMGSFQTGDQRRNVWIGTINTDNVVYHYPAKYKALENSGSVSEYSIFLRLAEQYLIRAEARIQQNKISDGISDLNVLRDRATDKQEQDINKRLSHLSSSLSKDEALNAVNYERRAELFSEGAHRLLDLKRTGQIDKIMSQITPQKGGIWSPYKSLYPIPTSELQVNLNLTQNAGYSN